MRKSWALPVLATVAMLGVGGTPAGATPATTAHRQVCAAACRSADPPPPAARPAPRAAPLAAAGAVSPPAGSWGYDLNGNGCAGTSFAAGATPQGVAGTTSLGFDAVQLNGWGWNDMYGNDPCFQAQVQWYRQNSPGSPIQFIMFPVPYDTNYCDSYPTSTSDGHTAGSGQAQQLYQKAVSAGLPVSSGMWWLDVEGAECNSWDPGKSQINLSVIQGAVDYLQAQGLTVGIYTDAGEWNSFTASNHSQFAGIPAWNAVPYNPAAGPYVTIHNDAQQNPYLGPASVLAWARQQCQGAGFTGGPLWAVQYMWGSYNAPQYTTAQAPAILGRDMDYACQGPTGAAPPVISALSGSGAMASTVTVTGTNFGSGYPHLWFTPDNPNGCGTDATTVSWGEPGNWAALTVTGWSNTGFSLQVPTPSGPNRQSGSALGDDLWMIPPGDTGCLAVVTSAGTSNTVSFTARAPATTTYPTSGWAAGTTGPGGYGLRGGTLAAGAAVSLVCSEPAGQPVLDQQGAMYPVWDLLDTAGAFFWVWDGMLATPPGGPPTHCSTYPAANVAPAPVHLLVGVAGFQMGQPTYVFGSGFGAGRGNGYAHLWTNGTAGTAAAACGDGTTTSTSWGAPGNEAAFTLVNWADTRVVVQQPTPSGPGHAGSQWQIRPGTWGCLTVVGSDGGAGQSAAFAELAPGTQSWATSGAANLRAGPWTGAASQGTASAGQSLTLICYDTAGEAVNGYATWDQLSSGLWVWDGLMATPAGGPTGLPKCANFPADL